MQVPIDGAGRLVIPKTLRAQAGIEPGTVIEIDVLGAGLYVAPMSVDEPQIVDEAGFVVLATTGQPLREGTVSDLRDAVRR